MSLVRFGEQNRSRWIGVRPGYEGEQVKGAGSVVNTTGTVYTVPAGKVLLLFWAALNLTVAGVGRGRFYHASGGATVGDFLYLHVLTAVGAVHPAIITFPVPYEIPPGDTLVIASSTATLTARGSFGGILINNT